MPSHRADTPPLRRPRKAERQQSRRVTQRSQKSSLSVPQVGIASALGLATIAAPLTGAMASPAVSKPPAAVNTVTAASLAPAPAFPRVAPVPANAVENLRLVPDDAVKASVPATLAAPRTLLVTRASRSGERPVLPGCTGEKPDLTGEQNGQLPKSALCTLWDPRHQLRSDAAVAIARLNVAYKQEFGTDICLTDSYRTYAQQVAVKRSRGSFAATPGTSLHGLGMAVDLCGTVNEGPSSAQYRWLRANAGPYGFANPDWALPGGSGAYEPWHWEFESPASSYTGD